MRSKIKMTILALMGMSLGVNSQNQTESYFQINADNGTGYVASKLYLKSHNDYRGAGIFSIGQTNNWFIGNPYTDHANSFMIGVTNISDGKQASAQLKYAKFYLNKDGDVGIGTTSPSAKLDVNGDAKFGGAVNAKTHLYIDGIDSSNSMGAINQLKISGYGIMGNRGSLYFTNGHSNGIIKFGIGGVHNTGEILTLRGIDKNANFKGSVAIGTETTGSHKLAVGGSIGAREIKVEANGWSDFVFYDNYKLPTLQEVESHIKEKGHLKDIPSAKEVEENGIFLGEMDSKLLQKIEELTLYTIKQEKKIKVLEKQVKEINELKILVKKLLDNKN